jgi:thiamine biosynthesis lipoprotein
MKSSSTNPVAERAQPWLGTLVSVRVEGLPFSRAHRAIGAAFAEIAAVHRLMSFHETSSDVSRMNRDALRQPVPVHSHTLEVLKCALEIAASSNGVFDISVGAELVKWGLLPRPAGAPQRPKGTWRDIEIRRDGRVAFHRPLCIDLGGIAKGYAVDRAAECLRGWDAKQVVVNAGGDLRARGPRVERIGLKLESMADSVPVVELRDGSVASSNGHRSRRWRWGRVCGPHIHGVRRCPAPTDRFVCVVAERCVVADALTKVVMADGPHSMGLLRQFGASAHFHDSRCGWQHLEGGPQQS